MCGLDEGSIDFSMDAGAFKRIGRNRLWKCLLSPTETPFYLSLSVLSAVAAAVIA